MKVNYFIKQILTGSWAIDFDTAKSYGLFLSHFLAKQPFKPVNPSSEEDYPLVLFDKNKKALNKPNRIADLLDPEIPQNSILQLNIQGALFKYDSSEFCGERTTGMISFAEAINLADQNENISGILLYVDSPGGTVDGTKNLADAIKACETPIKSYINGMAASAAAWLVTATDEIYASNELDQIGSVGVMISFADMQPVYEQKGVVFHTIFSDQSPDKNKMSGDIKKGDYTNIKKTILNPIADIFINAVKQNRPNVEAKHLTGKMFFAKDVVGSFIDGIMSYNDVLNSFSKPSNTKVYVQ